jgi:hypothetical protein
MLKKSVLCQMLLLGILIILPLPAFAIPSLTISSSGGGVYTLQGSGMQQVAGMQISVSYDSTTLSNPSVVMGNLVGEKMNVFNKDSNPLQIAVVDAHPLGGSGSGVVATINFKLASGSLGNVTVLTATLIDSNSKNLAVTTSIINPTPTTDSASTPTPTQGDTTSPTQTTTTQNSTGQPFTVGGTLSFPPAETAGNKDAPTQTGQVNQDRPVAASETSAPAPEVAEAHTTAPAPKEPAHPAAAPQRITSVLEKFKLFTGEPTVKALTALFNPDSSASFSQSPAIGIADGKESVTLLISKVPGDKAPSFVFNSARSVSVTPAGDGDWELVVKPYKGVVKASVIMMLNGTEQEFPLTVAPRANVVLGKSAEASEADFQVYLKDRGTASAPRFDMNGDGKRDYLDDYIYTANYLLKMQEKASKRKPAQSKAQ